MARYIPNPSGKYTHSRVEFKALRKKEKEGNTYSLYVLYQNNSQKFFVKCPDKVFSKKQKDSYFELKAKKEEDRFLFFHFKEDVNKINSIRSKIEKIVEEYQENISGKPSTEYVEAKFIGAQILQKKKVGGLLSFMDEFLADKKLTVRQATYNTYTNNKKILNSFFEAYPKLKTLPIENIDEKFISAFINYMLNEHVHLNKGKLQTVGFTNSVIKAEQKRLLEYISYCRIKFKVNADLELIKHYTQRIYKKDQIKIQDKPAVALTEFELSFYLKYIQTAKLTKKQIKICDVWFAMCLSGISYVDTMKINKNSVVGDYIIGSRTKSDIAFKTPLNLIVKEILEKYDYNLYINKDHSNEVLKWVWKEVYSTIINDYPDYDTTFTTSVRKGANIEYTSGFKWENISLKTARSTFITILANDNSVPLLLTKSYIGHTKSSTEIFGYINHVNEADNTDIIKIDRDI